MVKYCKKLTSDLGKIFDPKGFTLSTSVFDSSSKVAFTLDEFSTHYNPESFTKGQCDFIFKIQASREQDHQSHVVGIFRLKDHIGCAGIIVATDLYVHPNYRRLGISKCIVEFIEGFYENFGYGIIQATDIAENEYLKKTLIKRGWKSILSFLNRRTENILNLYIYDKEYKKDAPLKGKEVEIPFS